MRSVLLVLLYAITSATVASYAQGGKTYCNPLDLNYQYNFEQRERNISYRFGADPVLISHQGLMNNATGPMLTSNSRRRCAQGTSKI